MCAFVDAGGAARRAMSQRFERKRAVACRAGAGGGVASTRYAREQMRQQTCTPRSWRSGAKKIKRRDKNARRDAAVRRRGKRKTGARGRAQTAMSCRARACRMAAVLSRPGTSFAKPDPPRTMPRYARRRRGSVREAQEKRWWRVRRLRLPPPHCVGRQACRASIRHASVPFPRHQRRTAIGLQPLSFGSPPPPICRSSSVAHARPRCSPAQN